MEFFVTSDHEFEKSLVPILDKIIAHFKRIDRINMRPVKKPKRASKKKLVQNGVNGV